MRVYDKEKPLISIHVPKCGGTSFHAVLEQWFGANLHLHYFAGQFREQKPRRYDLKNGTCVHGHFNRWREIGVMDYYPDVDQFITILRDPFDTAVSYYFYAKGLGANRFRDGKPLLAMQEQFRDLGDYLRRGRKKEVLVKFLPYEVRLDNYEEIFDKHFIYTGITEDLQTSVDALAQRLGFPSMSVGRLNISVHDEEVTAELREEFVKNHPLSYAIYDYAVSHYKGWNNDRR